MRVALLHIQLERYWTIGRAGPELVPTGPGTEFEWATSTVRWTGIIRKVC